MRLGDPGMGVETKRERAQSRESACVTAAVRVAAGVMTFNLFVLAPLDASAQTPDRGAPSTPSNTAPPPESQGAFDTLGNWVQRGVANAGAGFGTIFGVFGGQANQAAKDAADAARNAAASVSKLPNTGITGGRERCIRAPNGAPDCRIAAETLCRAKGFIGGTSVDFVTVENCPPPYRTSRRDAPEGVCTTEHFVTRALCQ